MSPQSWRMSARCLLLSAIIILFFAHSSLFWPSDFVAFGYVHHHGETFLSFADHIVLSVSALGTRPDNHGPNNNCFYSQLPRKCESNSRICIPSSYSDWPISMPHSKFVYDFDRFAKLVGNISSLDMHFRLWQSVKWSGSHGLSCHYNHWNIRSSEPTVRIPSPRDFESCSHYR